MAKNNWEELKKEYIASDTDSASAFIRKKLNKKKLSGFVFKKITGWQKEKQAMREKAMKIAERRVVAKLADIYTPTKEELAVGYKATMGIFKAIAVANYNKIKQLKDGTIIIPPDVNTKETLDLWKVFRTEMGKPTNISGTVEPEEAPEADTEKQDVIFYLPDNGRDNLGK